MDQRWSVAKPLKIGCRVKLKTRWRKGQLGFVEERLDDRIDGLAKYGVRLDMMGEAYPPTMFDMCRFELSVQRT